MNNDFKTKTARLDIGSRSFYPTFGHNESGLFIQIKVGHREKQNCKQKLPLDDIERIRSLIEIICDFATNLLKLGWTKQDLIFAWRGTRFPPAGFCEQLRTRVSSPLDAVAIWLERGIGEE